MTRETIIWITIAVYAVFIGTVGIVNSRKTTSITDFTVGKRNAGAWLSAFSYGTAYFSAVMFIGYAGGTGWKYGLWGVLPGIGNAVFGSLLAWLVLAKRTRKITRAHKIKSMPQFFEARFASGSMKTFCVAVIFVFLVPYSASVYKGLTSICSVLLGIDERICMIVIAVAAAFIVTLGGYVATLKADFIQGIIMLVGVMLLIFSIFRCSQIGSFSVGMEAIKEKTAQLNLKLTDFVGLWATVLMTSFGTWGLPQMIHKYYAIRDDHEVKRGTIISTFFALVVAGGGYFIGSLSHLFYNSLDELPGVGAGKTDYLIPNMLLTANIPNVLVGVILVLLIAASVSTLSSITITASSTLAMDLVHPKLFAKKDKAWVGKATRLMCIVFIAASYFIANSNTPILDMMSYSWGIISGSFLAPYLISLYWKRISKKGAWAGMLSGFGVALVPVVCKLFAEGATLPTFGAIKDLGPHFACLAMVISFIFTFIFSLIFKEDREIGESFHAKEAVEAVEA